MLTILKPKKPTGKTILLFLIACILIFITSFTFGYYVFSKMYSSNKEVVVIDNSPVKTPQPYFGETEKNDDTKNILLIGYGGDGHSGGSLADSIILLSINTKTKKASFVSIPRDIWIKIPHDWENLVYGKINEAHAVGNDDVRYPNKKPEFRGVTGGGNITKYAASAVTGISVDFFISVSFDEFVKVVEYLEGIDVEVKTAFVDEYYPIPELENDSCGKTPEEMENLKFLHSGFELEKQYKCRYETLSFNKGVVRMDGPTALKFARSRHSPTQGSDFSRSERQIQLLSAVYKKLLSINTLDKIDIIFTSLSKLVTTDINLNTAKAIIDFLGNHKDYEINSVVLSTDNVLAESKSNTGQYILIPKAGIDSWKVVHKYISDIIN